ncbi:MAG TPA: hypothetical protein VF278_21930 [Pirellulales bacterium]
MSRRFQFSLRAVFAVITAIAVCCALWVNLSPLAKAGIVIFAVFVVMSQPEFLFCLLIEGLAWLVGWWVDLPPKPAPPRKRPSPSQDDKET